MSKLWCPFVECRCSIVPLEKGQQVILPVRAYDEMKIMLPDKLHEPTGKFLLVSDVWDFDNIGVSRDVPNARQLETPISFQNDGVNTINKIVKYLICAECDRGPLGIVCDITRGDGTAETIHLVSIESLAN